MDCENRFCVYWKKGKCEFESVPLDILGNCSTCIYINFDDDVLEEQREKTRKKLDG